MYYIYKIDNYLNFKHIVLELAPYMLASSKKSMKNTRVLYACHIYKVSYSVSYFLEKAKSTAFRDQQNASLRKDIWDIICLNHESLFIHMQTINFVACSTVNATIRLKTLC